MNGALLPKNESKSFLNSRALVEALFLVGLGVAAVWLHTTLRLPLKMPGRHGIEWMALLLMGRALSRRRGAASLSAAGAAGAAFFPMFAVTDDPFVWLTYLVPGVLVDVLFAALPRWQANVVFLGLLGALAHATKPVIRYFIGLASGGMHSSLIAGLGYPLATHLLFGLIGGLIGGGVILAVRRLKK